MEDMVGLTLGRSVGDAVGTLLGIWEVIASVTRMVGEDDGDVEVVGDALGQ